MVFSSAGMRSIVSGASETLLASTSPIQLDAARAGAYARTSGNSDALGLGGLRGDFPGSGRSSARRILAAALLARHPRVNVKSRAAALTEEHNAHGSGSLVAGQARARSNTVVIPAVSRQKIATNMPRSSSVQNTTPSSNRAISLK